MAHLQGVIAIWSGSVATIPGGWFLCDGTNGTPDLRDRFVVGAGSTYNPTDSGGTTAHTHTFTGDGHAHNAQGGLGLQGGAAFQNATSTDAAAGTTDSDNNLPPYYALAYIMHV